MDTGADERRRLPRYDLPGGVRPEEDSKAPPFEILDLSVGGIRFETDRRFPPGHRVRFWFDYYVLEFRVECEVAWARLSPAGAWEHGARFCDLTRAEKTVIGAYVDDLEESLKRDAHAQACAGDPPA